MAARRPDPALRPPDFAIVGAPKCGTTALYSYLATHPGIAMSAVKEPRFWSREPELAWPRLDRAGYDALWADAPLGALRGEATSVYLQSPAAIPDLLAARPDVRLIAMIRNPAEMAASRHALLLTLGVEDVADFEAAWRLQERRRRGEALPRGCKFPVSLQYRANAMIGDWLERFLETVPEPQRLVVVHDDFRADTRREYLRALAFLGLADDGRADFAPVNERRTVRWTRWPRFHRRSGRRATPVYRAAAALAHAVGLHPLALLREANLRAASHRTLRREFEEALIAGFMPQIEKVERLLGRDFSAWKSPRG